MKKLLIPGVIVLTAALAAGAAWCVVKEDREGPEITIDESVEITWNPDMEKAELLEGVSAKDAKEGDVTDSLVVESVKTDTKNPGQVIVTYVAKDSSSNVTKKNRNVPSGDAAPEAKEENAEEEIIVSATPTPTEAPETPEEKAVREREEKIKELPEDSPRFYLKEHFVTIKAGESFDRLSWIEDITDTKDAKEYLCRYVAISGDLNVWAPGTYELKYHATDSDGNLSNEEILTVTVE